MGIFRQFPYTNFHDLNLDWLLQMMKDLELEWDKFNVEWDKDVQEKVYQWLDEHPEATTTVQDNSLTAEKFTQELRDKTIKDYYTPQMFGAVGDGIADDTEAFKACSHLKNVVIPVGTYNLSEDVKLDHVVVDWGEYTNYKPLYKKDINPQISSVGYGKDIILPKQKSYAEAITYVNNSYYVLCKDYENSISYIAIYSNDLELVRYKDLRAVYTTECVAIHNDGEYIYIDSATGYHIRFDLGLNNEFDINNPNYQYIIPYNKYFYAIEVGNAEVGNVSISKMDGFGGAILETNVVHIGYQPIQSGSIVDGVLYLTTYASSLIGHYSIRIIDIATLETNEILYNSISELENIFEVNGEIKGSGHIYGFNGTFNIANFNGIDYPNVQYVFTDCSIGEKGLVAGQRANAYRIINGTQANLPSDVGDLFSFTDARLFINNNNEIWSYKDGWHLMGYLSRNQRNFNVIIGSNSIDCRLIKSGSSIDMRISGGGTQFSGFTSGGIIGTLPSGFRPPGGANIMGILRTEGNWGLSETTPCMISCDTDGTIKLNAPQSAINNAKYIFATGQYIMAT